MKQPPGYIHHQHPDYVCKLNRALYGLKQAPRSWFQRFASFITSRGFRTSKSDSSMFVYRHGEHMAVLLLYVDDILLTTTSSALLSSLIATLRRKFAMTDLGDLHYFLGISVSRTSDGLFLSQSKYIESLLDRCKLSSANPALTPIDTKGKLSQTDGDLFPDPYEYRSIVGAL